MHLSSRGEFGQDPARAVWPKGLRGPPLPLLPLRIEVGWIRLALLNKKKWKREKRKIGLSAYAYARARAHKIQQFTHKQTAMRDLTRLPSGFSYTALFLKTWIATLFIIYKLIPKGNNTWQNIIWSGVWNFPKERFGFAVQKQTNSKSMTGDFKRARGRNENLSAERTGGAAWKRLSVTRHLKMSSQTEMVCLATLFHRVGPFGAVIGSW